jgi:predicted RNA-binding Zn-ribbon protein involved in translation (DUF1610 family)
MSRGLGQTQRAILAALAGGKHGRVVDLAGTVYAVDTPTRAQRESVRRAVAHLEAAGLVTTAITDEVVSLRGQRVWNGIVRGAATATLSAARPEQHLEDPGTRATLTAPAPTTYEQRVAAREAGRPTLQGDHEAGKHSDLEEFIDNYPLCEVAEEALNAKEEAEYAARLKVERKEAREAARVRAAWIKANPDAIAWRCAGCDAELTDAETDQDQGALYECGSCGSSFSRANSADGESNRCAECGHFGAKLADLACPECGEGELEPLDPPEQHLEDAE